MGSIPFLKLHEAGSTYVPRTSIVCSGDPRGPAPQTRARPDPPSPTRELRQAGGRKVKPSLGVRSCSFEITRGPCAPAGRRLYHQIRLDLLISNHPCPCEKDPRSEIYGQFIGNSIPYQFQCIPLPRSRTKHKMAATQDGRHTMLSLGSEHMLF